MQNLKIEITKKVDCDCLYKIYKTLNWWPDTEEYDESVLKGIAENSFCFAAAYVDGKLAGIGRSLSDGVSDAYIQDIGVLPEYRGKGIGKKITEKLVEYLKQKKIGWIGLIAEPEAADFYKPLGFEIMKNYVPMKLNI